MDNKKNTKSDTNLVVGFRQVMRGLASNSIRCVTVACDIDEDLYNRLFANCNDKKVAINRGETKVLLGQKLGLDVPCGVFAELLVEKCDT